MGSESIRIPSAALLLLIQKPPRPNTKANFKATVRGHTAFILEAQPIFGIRLTYAFICYRSCVVKLRSYGYRKPD